MSKTVCNKEVSDINELEIIIPDDFHHHLRDDDYLIDTVYHEKSDLIELL